MNENKICFITCVNDERAYDECIYYIKQLNVPDGFGVEAIGIRDAYCMTAAYNKAMNDTDAKYKVYIHQDALIINKNFIYDFLNIFENNKNIGMIGLTGSKAIPTNAVWWESNQKYGKIYNSHDGSMKKIAFNEVEGAFEEVKCIDGVVMITQYDVAWREDIFDGWHFYDISQSSEFIKKGYKVIVPRQVSPWFIHDNEVNNLSNRFDVSNEYDAYRLEYIKEYSHIDLNRNGFFEFNKIEAQKILNDNRLVYENYKKEIQKYLDNNEYENVSRSIFNIADFLSSNHSGIYTCEYCEKALIECAKSIDIGKLEKENRIKEKKILHVISEGYSIGGHTKLLRNWINYDRDSKHSLIATWQLDTMPEDIIKSVELSGGFTKSLGESNKTFMERGADLRKLAYEWADYIVLYTHMMDPIPNIAFGVDGGPPVIYVSHAESKFWLGASISDMVVDLNEYASDISLKKRGTDKSIVVPIPLKIKESFDKNRLRKSYGVKDEDIILITIGSARKFRTLNEINYFKIVNTLIKHNKNIKVIMIGPENEGIWSDLNKITDGRFLCIGPQSDVNDYYKIADIYLDSFMIGGLTSELDAILYDLNIIKFRNDIAPSLNNNSEFLKESSFNNIQEVLEFIETKKYKKENMNKHRIIKDHIDEYLNNIRNIYLSVENHKVTTEFDIEYNISDAQLFLALYNNQPIQC